MSMREAMVKIRLMGREKIAQIGNIVLVETTFRVERPPREVKNVAHLSYQPLLPPPTYSEFVSIREASNATNLGTRKIQRLCRQRVIPCEKVGRIWMVHLPSLYAHLPKH